MIGKVLLYRGRKFSIYAITRGRKCLVKEFKDELSESDSKKVVALLKRAAEHGPPVNEEKFKLLRDRIFEFKSHQVRILCAFDKGQIIILTHGFIKQKGNTPETEIERARRLLEQLRQKEAYDERG
jgi:phage-related protein